MAYLKQKHACYPPSPHVHGDLWQCDSCERIWRAYVPGNPLYAGWRRVGWLGRKLRGL